MSIDTRNTVTDNRIADAVAQMRSMRLTMREIEGLYNRHAHRAEESAVHAIIAIAAETLLRDTPRGKRLAGRN